MYEMLMRWADLNDFLKCGAVKTYYEFLVNKRESLWAKRIFDIVFSLILIIILSPVFLVISIAIKADSKGPVFYRQVRVTKNNRDFQIFKFRTMVTGADQRGSLVTTAGDSRITRIGRKIRSVRLDELPQLFNIFLGDMSFVGTRPEVRKYVDEYTDEMKATLLLPAGVTSLASIRFKDEDILLDRYVKSGKSVDEAYVKYVLPKKMRYNLEALKNFSFIGEIKLMFKTVFEILK